MFGEQPSAAKWNLLPANDASFNDGSGIFGLYKNLLTVDSNPYKFSAYLTNAFSTGGSGFTKVPFNAEDYDTNTNYDAATNKRYTAPVAGFYHFDANILSAVIGVATRIVVNLYKNGTIYAVGDDDSASSNYFGGGVSIDMQLAANDYVEIFVFTSGAQAFDNTTAHATRFSGHLISRT